MLICLMQLDETSSICLEDYVSIYYHAWLMGNDSKEISLKISVGCMIGHYAHIIAKHYL